MDLLEQFAELLADKIASKLIDGERRGGAQVQFYTRKTSPLAHRVWNRAAGREFPVFKNGRSMMAKAEDVHAYIERHSSNGTKLSAAAADPFSYEAFAGAVRAKRLR